MFFRMVMFLWEFVLDLEIMLLRQLLRIVERNQKRGPQIPRWQKIPLAVLAVRLKEKAKNARTTLSESVRLFKPETVISWHRDLCDASGRLSKDANQDAHPLTANWKVGSCRLHRAPDRAWVTQQARQMTWVLEDRDPAICYLIHDHDTKFTHSFDTVFETEGIEIVNIPYQAPNANAIAERWVRSVREECLDRLIILNERHLRRVLKEYVAYYNERRPDQGLDQDSPLGLEPGSPEGQIRYRNILGGIIRDSYRKAA
jgi:hypothetical protein